MLKKPLSWGSRIKTVDVSNASLILAFGLQSPMIPSSGGRRCGEFGSEFYFMSLDTRQPFKSNVSCMLPFLLASW